jgi:hypothetical protein
MGILGIPVKHVTVTVASDGTIACAPDPVNVASKNALVAFCLATDGYHFPDSDAVVINTAHGDFPYSAWTIKPQLAGIADLCKIPGEIKYTVTVVNDATGVATSLDPVIHNGTTSGN